MAGKSTPAVAQAAAVALRRNGYCIIPQAVDPDLIGRVDRELEPHFSITPNAQGAFSGERTKRIGRLPVRSPTSRELIEQSVVMSIVETILGPSCDHVSLNLTQAIALLPGSERQVPHRDQDMWTLSRLTPPGTEMELLVNVIWPLTEFTAENGGTTIWPGSHLRKDELLIDENEAVCATMAPGSALMFLGSTLHAAGANTTPVDRRAVIFSYCLGWLKPYEIPWLAYPPAIARTFSPRLAQMVGYKVHRPNLGFFEGRCPSQLLMGDRNTGAIDALLPEQKRLIAGWYAGDVTPANFRDFVRST